MSRDAAGVAPRRPSGAVDAMFALALIALALTQPFARAEGAVRMAWSTAAPLAALLVLGFAAWLALQPTGSLSRCALRIALQAGAAALLLAARPTDPLQPAAGFWLGLLALALLAVRGLRSLSAIDGRAWLGSACAALFGLWVLYFWEVGVRAFDVPRVLLPAPSDVAVALHAHAAILAGDFAQTVLKAVVAGYLLGSGLGVAVGVAIDRAPFLQRGLLPLASLTSTVPLVGVAPIAVMWFGFDWPSKAAVIVLMTFFPALINTLAGLHAAGRLERELMHSYAAGYRRTLLDLRLPAALPFIFGALKINATLALIGAIVAEFFGSPTAGLGFRISTEAARMDMPLVWAAIVVAAVTGSLLYAVLVGVERRVNFWHPSVRGH